MKRKAFGPTTATYAVLHDLGEASFIDLFDHAAKLLPSLGEHQLRRVLVRGARDGWVEQLELDHWRLKESRRGSTIQAARFARALDSPRGEEA